MSGEESRGCEVMGCLYGALLGLIGGFICSAAAGEACRHWFPPKPKLQPTKSTEPAAWMADAAARGVETLDPQPLYAPLGTVAGGLFGAVLFGWVGWYVGNTPARRKRLKEEERRRNATTTTEKGQKADRRHNEE